MARWIESTPHGVSWLGFFYGGNIAGAVFGCLLAGFYLLRVHDSSFATFVAAAINGAVALAAVALSVSRRFEHPSRSASCPIGANRETSRAGGRPLPKTFPWPVYVTIALSGLTAIGAEVVWTRLLSLDAGRNGLCLFHHPGRVSFRAGHRQRRRLGARPQKSAARNSARLVPVFFDGGDFLDGSTCWPNRCRIGRLIRR